MLPCQNEYVVSASEELGSREMCETNTGVDHLLVHPAGQFDAGAAIPRKTTETDTFSTR